jgi:hypothetical protein
MARQAEKRRKILSLARPVKSGTRVAEDHRERLDGIDRINRINKIFVGSNRRS